MIRTLFALLFAALSFAAHAAVDINQASQAELESVKGIGPTMSERILEERKKGAFRDWNDLITRVKGVGDGNATKFSSGGLTVAGNAYSATAKPAAGGSAKPATSPEAKR